MKKLILLASIFMAYLAACDKPVNPTPEPEQEQPQTVNYKCHLPKMESGKTAWAAGDKILVHGGSSENQKIITLAAEDIINDTICTVNVEGVTRYNEKGSKVTYFAAYPADLVKNPADCKDKNTFIETNNLLLTGFATQSDTLFFHCIVGGLSFTVSGDFDSYELVGNYNETVGYETVTCRYTDKFTVPGQNDGTPKTSVSGSVTADGSTLNIIYFPFRQPSFQDGYKLFLCKGGEKVKVFETMGEIGIPRSEIVTVGDITAQLADYVAPDPNEGAQEVFPDYSHLSHLTFTETDDLFPNPERGFYFTQSFKGPTASRLTASKIESNRLENRTICYLGFYPKKYMDGHIGEDFLQMVRENMQVLRENGAKCIMRFAYSDSEGEKPWDATPEVVQMHIQDIKPILQEYGDVIMCLQAGFVGVWGEWYYTENFISTPDTPEEHYLRKEVIDAMLDALPADRSVGLRTPMFKRMMYTEGYRDTLTLATAYNESARARLSGFNDCFGASSSDQGTFDNDATREFWKKDSRYTLMGGETCAVSSYCECPVTLKDLADFHWTYLNIEYNKFVHKVWKDNGCWNEIERRLGYRLSLADAYHSTPAAGQDLNVVLQIKNTGYAAPMNGRAYELVLVDGNGNKTVYPFEDVDPRYWFAGRTVNIDKVITLPADASGNCTLYLNLPDPKPTLHDNPRFSIRLANEGVWNEEFGYNKVMEFTL